MKRTVTKAHAGIVLREYLFETMQLSKRLVKRLKAHPNGIKVNGQVKTVRYILQLADVVELNFPAEVISPMLQPEKQKLTIVYEDNDILVLEKGAGMPTMPSYVHPTNTLANGILGYYEEQQIPYTVHVVTRLDKDTSGLVLIAKHQHSHSLLSVMQGHHQIERKYQAFVEGDVREDKATIDAPIGRKANSIIERTVVNTGQIAITHFRVLKRLNDFTSVEVELETGRTHQIRVHFAHLGHPLVGDDLYGGSLVKLNRQALHCSMLRFNHPFTNEMMRFNSELPSDMQELYDGIPKES